MSEDVKPDAQVVANESSVEPADALDPNELSDKDLEQVSGGQRLESVSKAKTADKAYNAMDAYLKS